MKPNLIGQLLHEERQALGARAIENGWTYVDIAADIEGATPDNVNKIINRPGNKRGRFVPYVDSWLATYAHQKKTDVGKATAREVRNQYKTSTLFTPENCDEAIGGVIAALEAMLIPVKQKGISHRERVDALELTLNAASRLIRAIQVALPPAGDKPHG